MTDFWRDRSRRCCCCRRPVRPGSVQDDHRRRVTVSRRSRPSRPDAHDHAQGPKGTTSTSSHSDRTRSEIKVGDTITAQHYENLCGASEAPGREVGGQRLGGGDERNRREAGRDRCDARTITATITAIDPKCHRLPSRRTTGRTARAWKTRRRWRRSKSVTKWTSPGPKRCCSRSRSRKGECRGDSGQTKPIGDLGTDMHIHLRLATAVWSVAFGVGGSGIASAQTPFRTPPSLFVVDPITLAAGADAAGAQAAPAPPPPSSSDMKVTITARPPGRVRESRRR